MNYSQMEQMQSEMEQWQHDICLYGDVEKLNQEAIERGSKVAAEFGYNLDNCPF